MALFGKKKPSPPVEVTPPPVLPPAPPPVVAPNPELEKTTLKLNLPDVFAFEQDETKTKPKGRFGSADEEETGQRGVILLVESDEEIARLISRLLEHEGYAVHKSTCLAEARLKLNEQIADFVLARRHCVPANPQTDLVLRDIRAKAHVRVVDDFSELLLGQVIDYESMARGSLDLADLMMSLLEGANVGARGHAHSVAKYCRLVGQRLGLSRRELDAITLAALIHDLGSLEAQQKIGEPLYTQVDVPGSAARATLEMLATVKFPYEITELLTGAMAAAENSPPAGPTTRAAGILRVADAYDSLRRAQAGSSPNDEEIFAQMRHQPAAAFDSDVLETFIQMRKSEQAVSAMNIFWAAVLIVDPHPDEQQLLRLRLENDDFHVRTATSVEEALHVLRNDNITLVLSEHRLSGRGDGFDLLHTMRADPELRQIPLIFHSVGDTDLVKRALSLGAEDWLAKPHNVEIVAMKIQRIIARRHQGATGSVGTEGVQGKLADLGIIELVQILSTGSRSVQITLDHGKHSGELFLQRGQIIAATQGTRTGEAAALEMLSWEEGTFRLLPLRQPPAVTILASTDNLVLQACYLKDKKHHPEVASN